MLDFLFFLPLESFGADTYIDDDLDKLLPLVGIVGHLYLFAWPYNENEKLPAEIKRIHSWKEFYFEVCKIKRFPLLT